MQNPWEAIGDLVRLVPTPHNTQPFRIRPRGDRADLLLLCDRLLPAEDPGNAYVTSAFGVFAMGLERAGRSLGHEVIVTPIEALDAAALHRSSGTVVVGTATLGPSDCAPAEGELMALRRTSRLPYRPAPVAPAILDYLVEVAADAGHELTVFSDPLHVRAVLRKNAEAIIDNLQDRDEREEIRGWHRLGTTPRFGDGLWQHPMNQPAWQLELAFTTPRILTLPVLRELAVARYLRTMRGTQHVAVLEGPFSTWHERITAGAALYALWLAMAETGIYMHPFGSMLTNPVHAAWVARELAAPKTWLILRLGYSDPPPRSPRLASILVHP